MKKSAGILVLIFCFLYAQSFSQAKTGNENDLIKNNIKGKVKEITERTFKSQKTNTGYEAGAQEYGYILRYDDHGNQTQKIYVDKTGEKSDENYRHEFTYNDKGEKTGYRLYDNKAIIRSCSYQDGKCTVHPNENIENAKRLYDENGNLTDETFYEANKKDIASRMTYAYDEKKRIVRQQYFLPGNKPGEITTFTYDDENKSEEVITSDADGKFVIKQVIYKDEHGNKIRRVVYTSPTQIASDSSWTYTYDDEGNWIKQTSDTKIITREIIYYGK